MRRTVLSAIALVMLLTAGSSAAATDTALSVEPMVFEFGAPYGGEQQAEVHVSNPSSVPEQVNATAIDWSVLSDGSVSLLRQGANPRSLSPYMTVWPAIFSLRPGETRSIRVTVRLPKSPAKTLPTMWGGFLLKAAAWPVGSGITPAATILVYDSTQVRHPQLQLTLLRTAGRSHQRIVAHIVNVSQTYVRPVAHLVVRHGSSVLNDDVIAMNAILPRTDRWLWATMPPLPRGRYEAELVIDYGPAVLDGTTHVEIP